MNGGGKGPVGKLYTTANGSYFEGGFVGGRASPIPGDGCLPAARKREETKSCLSESNHCTI